MAILIDPARWPAHGILWSHLVSDTSLEELHAFARGLGLPRRSFDLDHYDIADFNYVRAVEAGAKPVTGQDVVRALRASGLRVRSAERDTVRSLRRPEFLRAEWAQLGSRLEVVPARRWEALGDELVRRWSESHRSYHDQRHLEDVLLALDHLGTLGEDVAPVTLLAAWFHDAVYEGDMGGDEQASADLAVRSLETVGLRGPIVTDVRDFIVATTPGAQSAPVRRSLAQLLDADLAIFGAGPSRYADYARSVREEFAHVSESAYRAGRAAILQGYLDRPQIFRLDTSAALWEARGRQNLLNEIGRLTAG